MKLLLSFISFILSVSCYSQVAVINDKDGWTNVRLAPDPQAEIIHKIYSDEVFWFNNETTDNLKEWIPVYIPKNKFSLGATKTVFISGYIHSSRLVPIQKLTEVKSDDFQFKYSLGKFNPTTKIIDRTEKWIVAINGRHAWGIDGQIPKIQVNEIQVAIGETRYKIDRAFYEDIFECTNAFKVYRNGDTYFVHQWNSDGAGAYEIVWVLKKDGLKQRLVGTIL